MASKTPPYPSDLAILYKYLKIISTGIISLLLIELFNQVSVLTVATVWIVSNYEMQEISLQLLIEQNLTSI